MNRKEEKKLLDSTIKLIEEGKKYKKMWEELYVIHGNTIVDDIASLTDVMEILEKKYFPKPKKELVKLVQELDRAVKELLEEVTK